MLEGCSESARGIGWSVRVYKNVGEVLLECYRNILRVFGSMKVSRNTTESVKGNLKVSEMISYIPMNFVVFFIHSYRIPPILSNTLALSVVFSQHSPSYLSNILIHSSTLHCTPPGLSSYPSYALTL